MPMLVRMDDARFDCVDSLKAALPRLPHHEQKLVACVMLLAMLLKGTFTLEELRLFADLYAAPARPKDQEWTQHGRGTESLAHYDR
jgi:hypothetical protein